MRYGNKSKHGLWMFVAFLVDSYKYYYTYNASYDEQYTEFGHIYSPLSMNIATKNIIKENILPPTNVQSGIVTIVTNLPITIAPKDNLPTSAVIFEIFSFCLLVSFTTKVYLFKTLKSRKVGGSDGKEN